ncbi:MAG: class I SAM-dependent methyltransferase [Roseivirga sp.]|uniref:class I SAM-dependent methyltransferase n=1 Tax=Roseivirga sp. TaxID=1964215 RepID=UPI001B22E628|nr:class I SAM-dependent methyltransferase [Roseivirga sp.]MBO6497592.1 class I SAM-dependent methyltransferase [Roseivirga sp.]
MPNIVWAEEEGKNQYFYPIFMMDVYSKALADFYAGKTEDGLWLNTSYGDPEEMPLWYFFRSYDEMPDLEKMALSVCEGRILDVGAGTGCHSLVLQHFDNEVTAIDTAAHAVSVMKESGLKNVLHQDFFELENQKFDTLLCLMNGLGFIGKLDRLESFLNKAEELLSEDGQIILDSSDISYLYENAQKPSDRYYGEVSFQYEYKGEKGEWFDWLYLDQNTLVDEADKLGWHTYILHQENDQYLARLIKK